MLTLSGPYSTCLRGVCALARAGCARARYSALWVYHDRRRQALARTCTPPLCVETVYHWQGDDHSVI